MLPNQAGLRNLPLFDQVLDVIEDVARSPPVAEGSPFDPRLLLRQASLFWKPGTPRKPNGCKICAGSRRAGGHPRRALSASNAPGPRADKDHSPQPPGIPATLYPRRLEPNTNWQPPRRRPEWSGRPRSRAPGLLFAGLSFRATDRLSQGQANRSPRGGSIRRRTCSSAPQFQGHGARGIVRAGIDIRLVSASKGLPFASLSGRVSQKSKRPETAWC